VTTAAATNSVRSRARHHFPSAWGALHALIVCALVVLYAYTAYHSVANGGYQVHTKRMHTRVL